jgi:hypothetical protein
MGDDLQARRQSAAEEVEEAAELAEAAVASVKDKLADPLRKDR